jgi:hypothetical protein
MEDYEGMVPPRLDQPPAPRRRGRRWLLIGGLALAFMLALGVGTLLGASNSTTQAAALTTGSSTSSQSLVFVQGANNAQSLAGMQGNASPSQSMAGGPGMRGAQGQCESLTVSSVNGNTIVAKTASGSSVTIHTTAMAASLPPVLSSVDSRSSLIRDHQRLDHSDQRWLAAALDLWRSRVILDSPAISF